MPPRNAFKTSSSFFRMLAVGAVGAQAVQAALNAEGHDVIELERGSLSTRIWRDVKRKRVRIPDLCCTRCGVRIESRAKTRAELAMSHSPRDAERAWDYGMLDGDWIAFPIVASDERVWSQGLLTERDSLWRESTGTSWSLVGEINIFPVAEFRSATPKQRKHKGVTEGSEIQVVWKSRFTQAAGAVRAVADARLEYVLDGDDKTRHFRLGTDERCFLRPGSRFEANQVVAGQVRPLDETARRCIGGCDSSAVEKMLRSRERTVRFTGCKLARHHRYDSATEAVSELARDPEEDPYVQMEAKSFLCHVAGESADDHFRSTLLAHPDDQMRLEAAVALAETRSPSAFNLLVQVLEDASQPLFLRSACAWALGCHGTSQAAERLVRAFGDVAPEVRDEALLAVAELGAGGVDTLVDALVDDADLAAGSAEALRRLRGVPVEHVAALAESSAEAWPTWTLAHLPKASVMPYMAALQERRPDVHFAVTVLWTFLDSWIAENWTPRAVP